MMDGWEDLGSWGRGYDKSRDIVGRLSSRLIITGSDSPFTPHAFNVIQGKLDSLFSVIIPRFILYSVSQTNLVC